MELSVWVKALLPLCHIVTVVPQNLVTVSFKWNADNFILHNIEWLYLIEEFRGTTLLSDAKAQEARAAFDSIRESLADSLRPHASPELFTAFMSAS
ncbi:MAG: hypothetical protein IJ631_00105 [Schwartzia sp.]|nr:hypothetical protein [Schwartzia sp. (in: firmicutes)]